MAVNSRIGTFIVALGAGHGTGLVIVNVYEDKSARNSVRPYRYLAVLTIIPSSLMYQVWLFGGCPGLYFDFATLSCQTPRKGSLWAKPSRGKVGKTISVMTANKSLASRFMIFSPDKK
jgi:hypothetical protein